MIGTLVDFLPVILFYCVFFRCLETTKTEGPNLMNSCFPSLREKSSKHGTEPHKTRTRRLKLAVALLDIKPSTGNYIKIEVF